MGSVICPLIHSFESSCNLCVVVSSLLWRFFRVSMMKILHFLGHDLLKTSLPCCLSGHVQHSWYVKPARLKTRRVWEVGLKVSHLACHITNDNRGRFSIEMQWVIVFTQRSIIVRILMCSPWLLVPTSYNDLSEWYFSICRRPSWSLKLVTQYNFAYICILLFQKEHRKPMSYLCEN